MNRRQPRSNRTSTPFPYPTLLRSSSAIAPKTLASNPHSPIDVCMHIQLWLLYDYLPQASLACCCCICDDWGSLPCSSSRGAAAVKERSGSTSGEIGRAHV